MDTLILSAADIRAIAQHVGLDALMDEMIRRLTQALREYDPAATIVPVRGGFAYDRPETGLLEWMPALQTGDQVMVKIVGYHPCNPMLRQLPTILSTISVYDAGSGHLVGLADATFVTALRTGAASAIASRILAAPESRVAGLIGCGAQAVTQLHALSRVFPLAEVLYYDANPAVMESFPARLSFLPGSITLSPAGVATIVRTSDILTTATSVGVNRGPVFRDSRVKPWLHMNAVGSDFPGKVEIPVTLLRRSFVCPDFRAQAVNEGECQQLAPEEIGPDLDQLVKDEVEFHGMQQRLTVFDSTGFALEDLVAMGLLLDRAQELGLGRRIAVENISHDPRDPYCFLNGEGAP